MKENPFVRFQDAWAAGVAALIILALGVWWSWSAGYSIGRTHAALERPWTQPTPWPEPEPSPCPILTAPPAPSPAPCRFSRANVLQAYERGMTQGREDWQCKALWKVPDGCTPMQRYGAFLCPEVQP